MSRTFIKALSWLAAAAWLSLGPAYGQSRAPHVPPPHAQPAAHTPPAKPTPPAHPATPEPKEAASPNPPPSSKPAPFVERIERNSQLATRLKALLPSGMTVESAAQGFKNEGQFIAALHVSHNLNIPFAQLKTEMTGKDHDSLGQAIHALMPTANAKAEARKADAEAKVDLKAAGKKADRDDK